MYGSSLLTIENPKTSKGESWGYLTGILYLAPYTESIPFGGGNLCAMASEGCATNCLFTAGRGRFQKIRDARIKKTIYFFKERKKFLEDLDKSIRAIVRKAERENLKPAIRLNGTSDYPFHKLKIMEKFPLVQFYDYTKIYSKMMAYTRGELPVNYHLTFSRSETNSLQCLEVLKHGGNVAAVFSSKNLPKEHLGFKVINADEHDLRFLDEKNVICGLKAKGKAKKDSSGFVIKV